MRRITQINKMTIKHDDMLERYYLFAPNKELLKTSKSLREIKAFALSDDQYMRRKRNNYIK